MNKKFFAGTALTGLVLAGGFSGMVSAQSAAAQTGLTEAQIIEIALDEVPGEVLDVAMEDHRGDITYEVEIMTADGTEMEVEISAAGDILEVEEDGKDCDKGKRDGKRGASDDDADAASDA